MDELNVKVGVDTSKAVNAVETIGEIKKTHPRMYGVAAITFYDTIENGDIDTKIPYAVRNGIMKAIEDIGYSITIEYDGSAIVNAIKKQLQHDA